VIRGSAFRGILCMCVLIAGLAGAVPAGAVPPDPVDDGNGKEFRQLYETTGVSWNQVAKICPRDGVTPCSGSIGQKDLTGWVWATDAQVIALLGSYAPAILTANPASVSGGGYYLLAAGFLGQMRWTGYFATTYAASDWAAGWTASDVGGSPVEGRVSYGHPPPSGAFSVVAAGTADEVSATRGVWLWAPTGSDHTPPVITSTIAGTAGSGGWYVSDVSVSWDVHDAESAIRSKIGCDPATVTSDTPETTFACKATSSGGTATAAATVKRDTTAPFVTCGLPAPVFELYQVGASVSALVADATSGPSVSPVSRLANTSAAGSFTAAVTGADRAGNVTTIQCPYQVVIPTCSGFQPTIVGTAGNDVINGTKRQDVIVSLGGADTVSGGGGNDVICGGGGPDTLSGDAGDDFLDGGEGNDSLRGGNGRDTCTSGELRMSSCEL
jgi:hemolysin type calcium-binding protein